MEIPAEHTGTLRSPRPLPTFEKVTNMRRIEFDYYGLYLRKYLQDENDPRQTDDDFINSRAEAAAEEFELASREGMSVDVSQERAIAVLMDGFD